MANVQTHLQRLSHGINSQNGKLAASLLSVRNPQMRQLVTSAATARLDERQLTQLCSQVLQDEWDAAMASEVLQSARALWVEHNYLSAYTHQHRAASAFKDRLQQDKEQNWGLPIMETLTLELRLIATRADDEATRRGTKPEALEGAMTVIREFFAMATSDRANTDVSKKWSMMFLVNQLLCIVFQTNNFTIVKSLLRAVNNLSEEYLNNFHIAHRVAYHYYVGRNALFEGEYKAAEESLQLALERCHRSSTRNKRLILIYLVPLNLLFGRLPKPRLLQKYQLAEFESVTEAVKTGNLQLLQQALLKHQTFFVQWGIYLLLEKLRIVIYRTLFKRV